MHFNIRKRISLIILSLSMAMAMLPNVAFASSEESAYATSIIYSKNDANFDISTLSMEQVNRSGILQPGQTISGTFKLTSWFGNDFTVVAAASNKGSGALSFSIEAARYDLPCDGVGRIICKETGWPAGTYDFSLYNPTGNAVAYSLSIYES